MASNDLEHRYTLRCSLVANIESNQSRVVAGEEITLASFKLPLIAINHFYVIIPLYLHFSDLSVASMCEPLFAVIDSMELSHGLIETINYML